MKLNNIRLLVKDFNTCFDFYKNLLGLEASAGKRGDSYASFNIGLQSGLSIFKSDLMAPVVGNADKELPVDARDKFVIIIEVNNVDALYHELSDRVEFLNPPSDVPAMGLRIAHLRDPEGNLLELFSNLLE